MAAAREIRVGAIYIGGEAAANLALDGSRNALLGTLEAAGRATLKGGILLNQGALATHNAINVGAATSGAVNASFGFMVAGIGSTGVEDGPYFFGRGNTFSAIANQRGNWYFSAGNPSTPGENEGCINFSTGNDVLRMRIKNSGAVNVISSLEMNGTQLADASRNVNAAAVVATVLKLTPSADPPANPAAGWVYMDTDNNIYVYNGSGWVQMNNAV